MVTPLCSPLLKMQLSPPKKLTKQSFFLQEIKCFFVSCYQNQKLISKCIICILSVLFCYITVCREEIMGHILSLLNSLRPLRLITAETKGQSSFTPVLATAFLYIHWTRFRLYPKLPTQICSNLFFFPGKWTECYTFLPNLGSLLVDPMKLDVAHP